MKVKINHNNTKLWCIYSKEQIPIGDKYIEVTEDYLGEEITKTYSIECLEMLMDEQLELDEDVDIDLDEIYE